MSLDETKKVYEEVRSKHEERKQIKDFLLKEKVKYAFGSLFTSFWIMVLIVVVTLSVITFALQVTEGPWIAHYILRDGWGAYRALAVVLLLAVVIVVTVQECKTWFSIMDSEMSQHQTVQELRDELERLRANRKKH